VRRPALSAEAPELWIIAGANGSGKSTAYSQAAIEAPAGSIWIINPDELSKRIAEHDGVPLNPDANIAAVTRIETWLYASIAAHQTVGVETVLSTGKYRALVEAAHAEGFSVRLIYVFLQTADLNVARVRQRVAAGGHDVAEAAIRDRRRRSFEQLAWFFEHADHVGIYDNTGAEPRLVVAKAADDLTVYGRLIPDLMTPLEAAVPGLRLAIESEPPPKRPTASQRRRRQRRRAKRRQPTE
jgi:predicted ABC-type ATPase